jgi:hypothetical protein
MKITEKQLKGRCSELNLGVFKDTPFGVKIDRGSKGYSCSLVYRDSTPPEILLADATAAEADACLSGIVTTTAIFSTVKDKVKPEYIAQEIFLKQGGERCPKCGTRDITAGTIKTSKSELEQFWFCERCETTWFSRFKLIGYELAGRFKESVD